MAKRNGLMNQIVSFLSGSADLIWNATSKRLTINAPSATSAPSMLQFTHGTNTGVTSTDGFIMGYPSSSSGAFTMNMQDQSNGGNFKMATAANSTFFDKDDWNNTTTLANNTGSTTYLRFIASRLILTSGSPMNVNPGGIYFGSDTTASTARIHILGGTASANTAPIKITSGTLNTAAVAGQMEYNGTHFQTTSGALRYAMGGTLTENFTDTGNVGTGEDDLYSYTTPASTLDVNGHSIRARYGGTFANTASTKQLKVYFGGTAIFDSTALTISATSFWNLDVHCIRVSSTVVRCSTRFSATGTSANTAAGYVEVTGLTLTNTNILKLTGTAAGGSEADNDIVAKTGIVEFKGNN